MSDAATTADQRNTNTRAQRRTWMIGGALLLLSAIVGLAARGPLVGISPAKEWLFAAAGVVLVVGIGRAGSVTGRSIVGSIATILLVIAPLTQTLWFGLVPDIDNPHEREDVWALTAMGYHGSIAVLAFVSVLAIGLTAVLPSPWRWAPAWVLIWTPLTYITGLFLFSSAPLDTPTASGGAILSGWGPALGIAFLGVVGIVLGWRAGATPPLASGITDEQTGAQRR